MDKIKDMFSIDLKNATEDQENKAKKSLERKTASLNLCRQKPIQQFEK